MRWFIILIAWVKAALRCLLPARATSVSACAASLSPPLDRYESDIAAYEERDKRNPPAHGGTVFAGSSTFTLWTDLEATFGEFAALNRGFGGSTIAEVTYYAPRVVLKYRPRRIVFYAGTNDIADGHTGCRVYQDFLEFARIVRRGLPECRLYFISASMGPARVALAAHYDEANRLVREHALATGDFSYIDVLPVMRDAAGKLKEEYFLEDRLHMNPRGYAAWTPVIRTALLAEQAGGQ